MADGPRPRTASETAALTTWWQTHVGWKMLKASVLSYPGKPEAFLLVQAQDPRGVVEEHALTVAHPDLAKGIAPPQERKIVNVPGHPLKGIIRLGRSGDPGANQPDFGPGPEAWAADEPWTDPPTRSYAVTCIPGGTAWATWDRGERNVSVHWLDGVTMQAWCWTRPLGPEPVVINIEPLAARTAVWQWLTKGTALPEENRR